MGPARTGSCAAAVAIMLAGGARGERAADTVASGGGITTGAVSDTAGAAGSGSVRTASAANVGRYLTDGSGRSLYMFERDTKNTSACVDACAKAWPPFTAGGAASTDTSVKAAMLGTISRPDNARQTTYNGMPVYYYEDDKKAGDIEGQGKQEFGGLWYLVSPSGQKIVGSRTGRRSSR